MSDPHSHSTYFCECGLDMCDGTAARLAKLKRLEAFIRDEVIPLGIEGLEEDARALLEGKE